MYLQQRVVSARTGRGRIARLLRDLPAYRYQIIRIFYRCLHQGNAHEGQSSADDARANFSKGREAAGKFSENSRENIAVEYGNKETNKKIVEGGQSIWNVENDRHVHLCCL